MPQRARAGHGRRNGIDLLYVYCGQRSDARALMCLAASTHHLSRSMTHDANGEGIVFVSTFNVTVSTLVASKYVFQLVCIRAAKTAHLGARPVGQGAQYRVEYWKNLS